jgi:restriction system protein
MSSRTKKLLQNLARKRRRSTPDGFRSIGSFHRGAYDGPQVSPYTRGAGRIDSEIFVLLQDWASEAWLNQPVQRAVVRLGRDPAIRTNQRLAQLLRRYLRIDLSEVYATNLFPYVKPGAMSSSIPSEQLLKAACRFALPQIRLLRPRLVICLGLATFNALCRAIGRRTQQRVADAIGQPFKLNEGTIVWCQAHTGQQGQNMRNRGGVMRTQSDWAKMAARYRRSSTRAARRMPLVGKC